jgi:metal-responsive CopG/Arc/MetJ family transcriptional regulator
MATTKQVKRYVYPVQLDEHELEALEDIVRLRHMSKSEAIREAVRNYADELKGLEVVKIRDLPKTQARKEVLEFLEENEHAWASDIADSLRLDISSVNRILEELWSEKCVEPAT